MKAVENFIKKEKSIKAEINIQHQDPVSFEKDTKEFTHLVQQRFDL